MIKKKSNMADRKILHQLATSCLKGKAITNLAENVPIARSNC